ncbi:UNVERIFIED_CONTAM: hypothetical protein NCL1_55578 [Trichonephila clavipes]
MQRLRLSNVCRHTFSLQYSVSEKCRLTRVADRSFRTIKLFPYILKPPSCSPITYVVCKKYKHISSNQDKNEEENVETLEDPPEKLTLFKRYKKMLKEYWYVLIPVHLVTSAFWFGGFYYCAKSGLDIIPVLEYISLPEVLIEPLRNSSLGHIAVASALYKLATPARYMVTLGGTTFSVKFLTKRGLIRPVPTKAEIKTIIQSKLKKDTPDDGK